MAAEDYTKRGRPPRRACDMLFWLKSQSLTIVAQISDPHVGGRADAIYQTTAHLQRAVAHLNGLAARPDLVLVTGDCVESGSEPEYERFVELMRPLRMPFCVIPGNHDDCGRMRRHFGAQGAQAMEGFIQYVVEAGPLRLLALDTQVPGEDRGELCAQRLRWLEDRLAEAPQRPTVIFQHHPPFAMGNTVLDNIGLSGAAAALGALVERYPNVERILAGHIHRPAQRRFHGTLAVTCPSTAHQVHLDLSRPDRLAMVMEPPACLLHVWSEETGLVTHSSAIGDYGAVREVFDGTRWLS